MPKREDIKKISLIGSGPIVIGQACQGDYSGALAVTAAIEALRRKGYGVKALQDYHAEIRDERSEMRA